MFSLLINLFMLTALPAGNVDSLVAQFEKAKGSARAEIATQIFKLLDEEEVTDSLMTVPAGINLDTLAMQVYYWAGEEKIANNDFSAASPLFDKAAALASKGKNLEIISDSYAELAYSLTREGKFDSAVQACEKAVDADTRLGDKDRLAISLNTMAYIYHMSRQGEEAEKYIRRSLELAKELNDTTKIALRYGTLSDILMAEGRFDDALESASEAFRLDSLSGNTAKMAIRRVQMAAPLFNMEQYDRAEKLLLQAEPVLAATGNMASLGICENQLGDIACRRENWKEAERHFGIAIQIYSHTGERLSESRARYGMYQALRHSDPAAAALHLERYAYLNDTIYSENVSRMTAEFDARYQNADLESRNEMLRNRIFWYSIVGLLVLIVLVLVFFLYYYRTREKLEAQEKRYHVLSERFSNLQNEVESQRPVGEKPETWLDNVDNILLELLQQGRADAKTLADKLCISSRNLSRKFYSATGLSTIDYILRFRMERACHLLSEGKMNISEVARECGIDDLAYFSRFFRKMTGMTPTEYQKVNSSSAKNSGL